MQYINFIKLEFQDSFTIYKSYQINYQIDKYHTFVILITYYICRGA